MQKLLSLARKAVEEFHMIEDGDKIAVGVSGGKDSLSALWALAELRRFFPAKYELHALTVDMGFGMDLSPIAAFCDTLGVPFTIVPTQMKEVIFDIRKEENPCSLCAKMRRGAVNSTASAMGFKKVALGHHYDDAVETFLMNLIFEGRIGCFRPVTWLDRTDVTVIRPLLYAEEHILKEAAVRLSLPVVKNLCPADGHTKRQEVKDLVADLAGRYPDIKSKVLGAMKRYPLDGWE